MGLQSFFMFNKSFHILIITITFTILPVQSLFTDSRFRDCTPQNCGNGPSIRYPFWIPQQQQSHCGSLGFNVTCKDDNPVLTISNDIYVIKDIFYANYSFLLTDAEVYDEDNTCPTPRHNFSIDGTPFNYSPTFTDLSFFYNCSSPFEFMTYSVECASNATYNSFAVFHSELLKQWNYSIDSCQSFVNAPVETDSIERLLKMNYTDVLRKGFVLQWSAVDTTCIFTNCKRSGSTRNLGLKLGIGFGAAGGSILLMSLLFLIYLRRNRKRYAGPSLIPRNISSHPSSMEDLEKAGSVLGIHIFTYSELEEATNYFDPKKELGDGGFGTVYQGKLRDGRVVAVKRLYEKNYRMVEQFMNEVEILTRLRHQNLVSLYGCTSRHCRELVLVYEYIPNGTVADHLHGERAEPGSLTWSTRMSIAIDTAVALAYLHASDVIHRDVKTNNILLDNNFGVKVADFGLSRLFPNHVTHISTAPQGTPGYVDPEYHECYRLTDKSDVFSFGVVLIELISSKPAVDITRHRDEINLSNMAIGKIQSRALHELVDPCLGFESDCKVREMITDVAELAFQCLQNGREMRPSMEEVLEALKGIQSKDYSAEQPGEMGIPADDAVLLKNKPLILSADSVTDKWVSRSTTPSIPADDAVFLKNKPPTLSPDSATDKWVSRSTTPSIPADDAVLLKNKPPTLSPDSVTDKWVSRSTTPNASG